MLAGRCFPGWLGRAGPCPPPGHCPVLPSPPESQPSLAPFAWFLGTPSSLRHTVVCVPETCSCCLGAWRTFPTLSPISFQHLPLPWTSHLLPQSMLGYPMPCCTPSLFGPVCLALVETHTSAFSPTQTCRLGEEGEDSRLMDGPR